MLVELLNINYLLKLTEEGKLTWTDKQTEDFHGLVNAREYNDRETYEFSAEVGQIPIRIIVNYKYMHAEGGAIEDVFHRLTIEVNDPVWFSISHDWNPDRPETPEEFITAKKLISLINTNSPALWLV